jgi:nicotinamidase-related amidase
VLVNVTGKSPGRTEVQMSLSGMPPDWSELAPGLEQDPGDHTVSKQRWGAFIGTDLNDFLRKRDVTQIVLTGISTSAGVESTARSAFDYGYNVVIAIDAIADRNPDAHTSSVEKVFPRLGETGTVDEIIQLFSQPRT